MSSPDRQQEILSALSQLPLKLPLEEFAKHPAIQALKVGPFFLVELYELYTMYDSVPDQPLSTQITRMI